MIKEILQYPLQIKGCQSSEFSEVISPYSGEVIAAVAQADEKAIDQAITVARETFKSTMSKLPAHKRSEILAKTAKLMAENSEDLARTIALEGGKPIKDARIEVSRAIGTFQIASEEALRLDGEQLPMDRQPGNEGRIGIVLREPIGVVAAITPFNFPINLVAHKLAPAFAAGNTVVLKPSSQTPISSFKLAKFLTEAGLPDGALLVVPCRGSKGNALVRDPRIAMLTFTGSPEVGWRLRSEVSPGVRTILELGGNAGLLVHDDADLESAARAAARGGYANAGQTCISVQRVYVQERVYDKFLDLFVAMVRQLKSGDPLDDAVDVGPLIDKGAVEKTVEWLDAAVKKGAKLVTGGKQLPKNVVEPAVLVDTKPDMLVVCQEVFGPIVSVMKYDTIDNAIDAINDPHYGLQAGIFTKNLEIAFKAARKIDVGGVMINDAPTFRADHMPYGGRKESGIGLEGVKYALQEMTQPKFICLNLPKLD
jgi:acyl-CoA reductase-like NAD-dependent aldehyde dehydrogenase